jgi:threonine/homoserine/homoserine lactone efflux protein
VIEPSTVALFALAALALIVIPGPAVLYIVAQSIGGGRSAGLVSALGVATGALVHVGFAIVGLSALLVASAEAFTVVKLVGAAYLIWLGITTLLRKKGGRVGGHATEYGKARLYRRGVVVNVLNPKTAIFFLAFLPQFVDQDGPVRAQLAVLGLVFVVLALASDAVWAIAAGSAAAMVRGSERFLRIQRRVSGTVYIGLGLATALTRSHHS